MLELLDTKKIKYTIENDRIIINQNLNLKKLKTIPKEFLNGCTVNGYVNLENLVELPENCFNNCIINGDIDLSNLLKINIKQSLINSSSKSKYINLFYSKLKQKNYKRKFRLKRHKLFDLTKILNFSYLNTYFNLYTNTYLKLKFFILNINKIIKK